MNPFAARDKAQWQWTMMIMIPDWSTAEMFVDAASAIHGERIPPS
jgi:hypothetical protein